MQSAVKLRVVVTGMGAASPNGIGRDAFWNPTRRGQSGVRRITRFDASRHQVQIAGEVTGFDESVYVAANKRQHVSRAVPLAIAAASEAVSDAGIEPERMSREQLRTIGVLIGSGGGSQEFTEEPYRLYYSGHQKQGSVYTIPTSIIGTPASEISMRFGFRGPSQIISTGCTSSTDAPGNTFNNIQWGVSPGESTASTRWRIALRSEARIRPWCCEPLIGPQPQRAGRAQRFRGQRKPGSRS
jgi:3-oxoacyl-[acyl-carrier-protein] synthase II